jgi:SP family facilitated glucose transporter-like MFS transporter 8
MTAQVQSITIGVIQVVMTFVSTLVADKFGRRVMLISSELIMGFCTFSLGFFFILKDNNSSIIEYFNWLPVTSLGFFIFAYGIGVGPIPFSVISEVCAADIKGTYS